MGGWLVNMILAAKYIVSVIYYCLLIDREHSHHCLITFSYCIRCDGKKQQKVEQCSSFLQVVLLQKSYVLYLDLPFLHNSYFL